MRQQDGPLPVALFRSGKVIRYIWKDAADDVIKSFHFYSSIFFGGLDTVLATSAVSAFRCFAPGGYETAPFRQELSGSSLDRVDFG
jgi:hypothetical protein